MIWAYLVRVTEFVKCHFRYRIIINRLQHIHNSLYFLQSMNPLPVEVLTQLPTSPADSLLYVVSMNIRIFFWNNRDRL